MREFRLVFVGIVAAALSFVLSGCTHPTTTPPKSDSAGPIQLAIVTNNASDYWIIASSGANKAAVELGNKYEVHFVMPEASSAAVQERDVDDLIASGVKAVALSPVDAHSQTAWINAIAQKIPVLTQDGDAPGSDRLAYLGTDNHDAGLLAGATIKHALPNGGKIALFVGNRSAQNAHDREWGIRDALKGSNIDIVDVYVDNAVRSVANTNAIEALNEHPDLSMEVGLYSYDGPAILSAVEETHNVGKIKIVTFDQPSQTLAGIKSGVIYAAIVQQPYQFAYETTKLLSQLAQGDKSGLPKGGIKYFPAQVVNAKNVDSYIYALNKETGMSWGDPN